jgi:protein phosphatase 1 regulatory subunit 7
LTKFVPIIDKWRDWKVLWINTDHIDACLAAYEAGEASAIGILDVKGFRGTDLSILTTIANLQGLVIPYPENLDVGVVKSLSQLRFLVLGKERAPLDFSVFAQLLELSTDWKSSDVLPNAQSGLERLSLWGFRPKSRDLESLPAYKKLIYLKLVQGSVECLDGIEKYVSLNEAEFAYLRQLKNIAAIGSCSVETLDFDACRKIEDFASLAKCPKLKLLRYTNCGSLPSLAPLKDFKALENFRFVATNILDGDMSPLLRLNSTGFMMKRHYSHTPEQIAAAIADITFFKPEDSLRSRVVDIS